MFRLPINLENLIEQLTEEQLAKQRTDEQLIDELTNEKNKADIIYSKRGPMVITP